MGLDIRLPIGGMFAIFGVVLGVYGMFTQDNAMYLQHSLGININLWWGGALFFFGVAMLLLALRKKRQGAGSS